jgi:hypothetical protein
MRCSLYLALRTIYYGKLTGDIALYFRANRLPGQKAKIEPNPIEAWAKPGESSPALRPLLGLTGLPLAVRGVRRNAPRIGHVNVGDGWAFGRSAAASMVARL